MIRRLLSLLFLIVCLGATVAGDVWLGRLLRDQARSAGWPTVVGEMAGDGVGYRYLVNGVQHQGGSARLTGGSALPSWRDQLDAYRPGRRVPVHYDPRQPQRSVLEAGLTPADLRGAFLLLPLHSFLLIPLAIATDVLRRGRMRGPALRRLRGGGVRVGYPAWRVAPLMAAGLTSLLSGGVAALLFWQLGRGATEWNGAVLLLSLHLCVLLGTLGLGWLFPDQMVTVDLRGNLLGFPGGRVPLSTVSDVAVEPGAFGQPRCLLVRTEGGELRSTLRLPPAEATWLAELIRNRLRRGRA